MTVALYAGSSGTDQNCDLQIRKLREYAARRGWVITGEYVDREWPRKKIRCPKLNRLMDDARLHRFDAVICLMLDGFGRSVGHAASVILELCSLGVRFLSVSERLFDTDQSNPASQPLMQILAWMAQLERARKGERIAKGMKRARAKGNKGGRRRRVLERHERRRLFELRAKGASYATIARELGIGFGTVARFCAKHCKKLPG